MTIAATPVQRESSKMATTKAEASPRSARWRTALLAIVFGANGCAWEHQLCLRTDYRPGEEFATVRTRIGERQYEMPAHAGEDYVTGRVVAAYEGDRGRAHIDITLLDQEGSLVAQRIADYQLHGSGTISVLLTRDCAPLDCTRAETPFKTCLDAQCVDAACLTGEEPECTAR